MAIALAAMYAISERYGGLSSINNRYYFVWTYGPTALFTLVMVYWTSIEYRAKQLLPWMLMQKGFTPASQSILLDYVSSWKVLALCRSLRHGYFFPALAISGTLLTQLMIVFSTGLLATQEIRREVKTPVTINQAFNTHGWNQTVTTGQNFDPMTFMTAYGVRNFGVSYPFGTTTHHAFTTFGTNENHGPRAFLQAEVDVFTFDLICEPIERVERGNISWVLVTPSCNISINAPGMSSCSYDPACYDFGYSYCNPPAAPKAGRFYHYSWVSPEESNGQADPVKVTDSTGVWAMMCRGNYNISRGSVTYSESSDNGNYAVDVQVPGTRIWNLPNISADEICDTASAAMALSNGGRIVNLPRSSAKLQDFDYFSKQIRDLMSAVSVQVARTFFLKSSDEKVFGTTTFTQTRLVVRALSFGLVEGILVILIGFAAAIAIFHTSSAACSADPGFIGAFATILARSDSLVTLLDGTACKDLRFIKQRVTGIAYRTVRDHTADPASFKITDDQREAQIRPAHLNVKSNLSHDKTPSKWWRPFSVSKLAQLVVIGLPLSLILTLEFLYRDSETSHPKGIAYVMGRNNYVRYSWVYIPAFVMTIVQVLFASLYFATKLFQPYHALRQGAATARESVMDNRLGSIALQSLLRGIIRRQPAIVAMSTAALLAPLLTIVSSGLYTTKTVDSTISTTVTQNQFWHFPITMFSQLKAMDNVTNNMLPSM